MKITREQLKGIVREVMTEESEYQTFFKKALEKTGKSIPDMSDEEKKDFFNKIDSAWNAKGEKNEAQKQTYTKVNITQIKKGDIIKFSVGLLGTHTAVALGRIEKSSYQNQYSLPIRYLSTTQPKYTEVGKEGVVFFKNYKSTVNKLNKT
jgi:hypothetical protein